MDRDLIEKLLAAQVLTLAYALRADWHARNKTGSTSSDFIYEAIRDIREKQAELIARLLAVPGTEGG